MLRLTNISFSYISSSKIDLRIKTRSLDNEQTTHKKNIINWA